MIEIGLRTTRDLANKAHLSESTVAQWIGGKGVRPDTLARIAKGLGLSVADLERLVAGAPQQLAG
jgi:transcriptional regulator with XRE-family HTH domain